MPFKLIFEAKLPERRILTQGRGEGIQHLIKAIVLNIIAFSF